MKKLILVLSVFVFIQAVLYSQTNAAKQEPTSKTQSKQRAPVVKTIMVKGQVCNAKTKKPVQGAYVIILGTPIGTITDNKGNFRIEVPEGAKLLSFSAEKYSAVKIDIDTTKEMKINLIKKK